LYTSFCFRFYSTAPYITGGVLIARVKFTTLLPAYLLRLWIDWKNKIHAQKNACPIRQNMLYYEQSLTKIDKECEPYV